jgi:hypothetical protein
MPGRLDGQLDTVHGRNADASADRDANPYAGK